MTREECETKLYELAEKMREVINEYGISDESLGYLTVCIMGKEYVQINNAYYAEDAEYPIDFCHNDEPEEEDE